MHVARGRNRTAMHPVLVHQARVLRRRRQSSRAHELRKSQFRQMSTSPGHRPPVDALPTPVRIPSNIPCASSRSILLPFRRLVPSNQSAPLLLQHESRMRTPPRYTGTTGFSVGQFLPA